MPNERTVRAEQTGKRDLALSGRHRRWGWDCPAADVDLLLVEYDGGKAVAIVEYKRGGFDRDYFSSTNYRAIVDLGDRAGVPVIDCRYTPDFVFWKVVPLNDLARAILPPVSFMSEEEWVTLLYRLRGRTLKPGMFDDRGILI